MSGYTKLFSDIVESSIWNEPPDTCKVWITLLALSDQDGYVRGSVGWLAGKARVSKEKCAAAIELFQRPDEESRTPDHEGRRIEALDDGWLILNYIAFRDRLSANPQAVATRERVKRHRERYRALRNAESVTTPVSASASVSVSSSESLGGGCKGEESFSLSEILEWAASPTVGMPKDMATAFFDHYNSVGWLKGTSKHQMTKRGEIESAMRQWKTREPSMGNHSAPPANETNDQRMARLEIEMRRRK